jgi:protein phosphatase 1 regulatory subunit 42
MIRNIPNKYSQKILLRLVDLRFRDKYDFFYLPIDYKHRCNVGYAFINFFEPSPIPEFFGLLNDKKWDKFNSEKVCKITYARLQGQDALLDHFKSSSVMQQHKQMRPYFVKDSSNGLIQPSSFIDGSVIDSVWSETSQGTTGGATSPTIPPLASLNLGTVEGSIYSAVHGDPSKLEIKSPQQI